MTSEKDLQESSIGNGIVIGTSRPDHLIFLGLFKGIEALSQECDGAFLVVHETHFRNVISALSAAHAIDSSQSDALLQELAVKRQHALKKTEASADNAIGIYHTQAILHAQHYMRFIMTASNQPLCDQALQETQHYLQALKDGGLIDEHIYEVLNQEALILMDGWTALDERPAQ